MQYVKYVVLTLLVAGIVELEYFRYLDPVVRFAISGLLAFYGAWVLLLFRFQRVAGESESRVLAVNRGRRRLKTSLFNFYQIVFRLAFMLIATAFVTLALHEWNGDLLSKKSHVGFTNTMVSILDQSFPVGSAILKYCLPGLKGAQWNFSNALTPFVVFSIYVVHIGMIVATVRAAWLLGKHDLDRRVDVMSRRGPIDDEDD